MPFRVKEIEIFGSFKQSYLDNLAEYRTLTGQNESIALKAQYTAQLASLVADQAKMADVARRNDEALSFFAARKKSTAEAFSQIDAQLRNSPRYLIQQRFLWFTRFFQIDYTRDVSYQRALAAKTAAEIDYNRAVGLKTSAKADIDQLDRDVTSLRGRLAFINTEPS